MCCGPSHSFWPDLVCVICVCRCPGRAVRQDLCVCVCVSTAQWNDFRSPQGADTGGHRRRLCLCGHHPYCLGVCGVSEVSEHMHTHTHTHTHTCIHTHTHTHTHTHMHTHTHTRTHTRTRTRTRTHTHTHKRGLQGLSIGVMVFILYKQYILYYTVFSVPLP